MLSPRAEMIRRILDALDACGAGLWLGLTQVALGFALLAGSGATAVTFFALTTAWLAGGALAAWARPRRIGAVLASALGAWAAARWTLTAYPFARWTTGLGWAAGACAGAYGGAFFASRAGRWARASKLLFWENNGFVLGWAAGTVLLFVAPTVLDLAVAILGLALCATEYARPRPLRY